MLVMFKKGGRKIKYVKISKVAKSRRRHSVSHVAQNFRHVLAVAQCCTECLIVDTNVICH